MEFEYPEMKIGSTLVNDSNNKKEEVKYEKKEEEKKLDGDVTIKKANETFKEEKKTEKEEESDKETPKEKLLYGNSTQPRFGLKII